MIFSEACKDQHQLSACTISNCHIGNYQSLQWQLPIAAVIGNNAGGIRDNVAGISNNATKNPMLNSVLNGGWSNSVPGRKFPKGPTHSSFPWFAFQFRPYVQYWRLGAFGIYHGQVLVSLVFKFTSASVFLPYPAEFSMCTSSCTVRKRKHHSV